MFNNIKMRKRIVIIMLTLATAHSSYAQKVAIGLQGGLNLDNLGLTKDSFPITHSLFGYQGGAYTRVHFLKYFAQVEASFMNQRNNVIVSSKTSNQIYSDYISANFFMAGCLVGYKIGILRLSGGIYMTKQLSQKFELNVHQDFTLSPTYQTNIRAGVQAGLGLKIAKKWNIDFRAMMALNKSQYKVTVDQTDAVFEGLARNLTVTLGYNIFSF